MRRGVGTARARVRRLPLVVVVALVALVVLTGCREDDPALDVGTPTSTARPSTTTGGPSSECPETAPQEDGTEDGTEEGTEDGTEEETLDGSLAVRFTEPLVAGAPVTWTLSVKSEADEPVTLVFPSGQDGDLVLERDGAEVYRWSDGTFFTQAIRCRDLPAGATLTFELRSDSFDVEPGDYTLRATLAASPAPPPLEQPVTVTP